MTDPRRGSQKESRHARWDAAVEDAEAALNALVEIQDEYSYWWEDLTEDLQESKVGLCLEEIAERDIRSALETVEALVDVELPLEYGVGGPAAFYRKQDDK